MMQVMILENKHDKTYLFCPNDLCVKGLALEIVKDRLESEVYYTEDQEIKTAQSILEERDGGRAWQFLMRRSGYEYEGVYLQPLWESYEA